MVDAINHAADNDTSIIVELVKECLHKPHSILYKLAEDPIFNELLKWLAYSCTVDVSASFSYETLLHNLMHSDVSVAARKKINYMCFLLHIAGILTINDSSQSCEEFAGFFSGMTAGSRVTQDLYKSYSTGRLYWEWIAPGKGSRNTDEFSRIKNFTVSKLDKNAQFFIFNVLELRKTADILKVEIISKLTNETDIIIKEKQDEIMKDVKNEVKNEIHEIEKSSMSRILIITTLFLAAFALISANVSTLLNPAYTPDRILIVNASLVLALTVLVALVFAIVPESRPNRWKAAAFAFTIISAIVIFIYAVSCLA